MKLEAKETELNSRIHGLERKLAAMVAEDEVQRVQDDAKVVWIFMQVLVLLAGNHTRLRTP